MGKTRIKQLQDGRGTKNRAAREELGTQTLYEERRAKSERYNLSWFKPIGQQQQVWTQLDQKDAVIIQAPSGCGKTTTAIAKALQLVETGDYKKVYFIKNPTEAGDDKIGYLTGDANDKLQAHFMYLRAVFLDFMSAGKLACEEKNKNIIFAIPNFLLGATIPPGSIVILDECQTYSPSTLKLLMERVSDGCKLILLGDRSQRYSVTRRDDGFTDFIKRITRPNPETGKLESVENLFSYIEMDTSNNQRGDISKRITELYSDLG